MVDFGRFGGGDARGAAAARFAGGDLRETAASPQKKPPRGSFDSNDSLASFVSSAAPRGRRPARLRTVV